MKVTNNNVNGAQAKIETGKAGKSDAAGGLKNNSKTTSATTNGTRGTDSKVDVSERAQMMQKAKDIAGQPMTVDEAKVARIQKMIDEGSYKVDADKVADRLLDEHLQIPD